MDSGMVFCQNKLCRAHVDVDVDNVVDLQHVVFVNANGERVGLRRIKIKDDVTKIEFDFCEVCANVLAIVHGTK